MKAATALLMLVPYGIFGCLALLIWRQRRRRPAPAAADPGLEALLRRRMGSRDGLSG